MPACLPAFAWSDVHAWGWAYVVVHVCETINLENFKQIINLWNGSMTPLGLLVLCHADNSVRCAGCVCLCVCGSARWLCECVIDCQKRSTFSKSLRNFKFRMENFNAIKGFPLSLSFSFFANFPNAFISRLAAKLKFQTVTFRKAIHAEIVVRLEQWASSPTRFPHITFSAAISAKQHFHIPKRKENQSTCAAASKPLFKLKRFVAFVMSCTEDKISSGRQTAWKAYTIICNVMFKSLPSTCVMCVCARASTFQWFNIYENFRRIVFAFFRLFYFKRPPDTHYHYHIPYLAYTLHLHSNVRFCETGCPSFPAM